MQESLGLPGLTQAERIRAANRAYFTFLTADPRRARVYALESVGISPELERHRRDTREHFVRGMARGIERLAERGFGRGLDATLVSAALAGAAHGLIVEWLLFPKKLPPVELADTIATLWMRTLEIDPAGDFALE